MNRQSEALKMLHDKYGLYLTVEELGHEIKLSPRTIIDRIHKGRPPVPVKKIHGRWLASVFDVVEPSHTAGENKNNHEGMDERPT